MCKECFNKIAGEMMAGAKLCEALGDDGNAQVATDFCWLASCCKELKAPLVHNLMLTMLTSAAVEPGRFGERALRVCEVMMPDGMHVVEHEGGGEDV